MDEAYLSILPILQTIPLFKELNEKEHHEIIKNIKLEYFQADSLLFSQGDAGDKLYIIRKGKVQIFHPKPIGKEEKVPQEVDMIAEKAGKTPVLEGKEVAILGENDFFGEMALICDEKRTASAKTLEDTEVFTLTKEDFLKLLSGNQNLGSLFSKEFLKRVKENTKQELW